MAHAEAVFLVDDEQAQVFELRFFAQQFVRAHDDVHRAVGHALEGGVDFLGAAKAAHLGHFHGPLGKAVAQGLVVLLGQQRGGGQKGHLLAAGDGHEGRAQGHFGLAKAHVAAHQAVHGLRRNHVLYDGVYGRLLVGRFLEAEVGGELLVVLRAVAKGVALARGAAGVDVEQLGGGVPHLLGGLAFGLVPLAAAQLVQRRFFVAHAGVAADQVKLAHGHIQHGLPGVFQVQKLLQRGRAVGVLGAHVHVHQPPVAAYAVLHVHHGVAHVQLGQVADEGVHIAGLLLPLAAARPGAGGKQLGFGDEVDAAFRPGKAARQRRRGHAQRFGGLLELGQAVEHGRLQAAGAQKVQQALAPPVAFGQHQRARPPGLHMALEFLQGVFGAAHHGQIRQRLHEGGVGRVLRTGAQGQLRVGAGGLIKVLRAQKQAFGRQHGPFGIALRQPPALARVLPKVLKSAFQIAVQRQRQRGRCARPFIAGGQVVEHRGRLVEKQRKVVLDARRGQAVAHVLVDAAFGGIALQQLAPAVAEFGARGLVHRKFAPGQQAHLLHRVQAALAVGIEGADGVDLVIEQIHPVRLAAAHRKQVDQPAAHRVFARAAHLRDVLIARQRELAFERRLIQPLPLLEMKGVARHERRRRQAVERRRGGHQHHIRLALAYGPQRGQALADQVLMRAESVVGQRFPIRKQRAAQLRREKRQLIQQPPGVARIGANHGQPPPASGLAPGQLSQQQRIGRSRRAGHGIALARSESGQKHGRQKKTRQTGSNPARAKNNKTPDPGQGRGSKGRKF